MKTLEARFKICTPMFLGGAEPQHTEGLRAASLKGALRFWWRALNWQRCAAWHPEDTAAALRTLHMQEARLFGIAADDKKPPSGGQGVFLLEVHAQNVRATDRPFGASFDGGLLYLLGMGLGSFSKGNHCTRSALAAGGTFDVRLLFRPNCAAEDVASVVQALQAFGLLGALGSRARHGMGSVCLVSMKHQGLDLPDWVPPSNPTTYQEQLRQLLAQARQAPGWPPFSALSQQTRIDMLCPVSKESMGQLLEKIGREQQIYRSYGKSYYGGPHMIHGQKAEQNFADDHHLMFRVADGQSVTVAPERTVFGLPHNYYFSNKTKAEVNYKPFGPEPARRASPLLLHVHEVGGRYVAVHTLLAACFLPDRAPGKGPQVSIGKSRVDLAVNWQVLHDYLDRFKTKHPTQWSTL